MPYPLPEDVGAVTGVRWFLVAIPDDPAYTRAALGAYTDLGHYWKWGLEGPVPVESDLAAQHWLSAIDETMEALEMGFPDVLLGYIDEVETLLRDLRLSGCCVAEDVTGGAIYTDSVTDGEGDVPQNIIDAGYATGVSDWTGFAAYKCMIANVAVDTIIRRLREFEALFDSTGDNFLGPLGAVVAILGFIAASALTGGAALVVGLIGSLGAATSIYGYLSEFSESQVAAMADAITGDVREALTCAIVLADGTSDAISRFNAAVDDNFTAAQALFIKNLNIGPTIRALYAGRYEQQDVAGALADQGFSVGSYTCDCQEPFDVDVTWTFDADAEGWTKFAGSNDAYDGVNDELYTARGASDGGWQNTEGNVYTKAGLSVDADYQPGVLEFDAWYSGVAPNPVQAPVNIYWRNSLLQTTMITATTKGTAQRVSIDLSGLAVFTLTQSADAQIKFTTTDTSQNYWSATRGIHIDNVRLGLWLDA